VLQAAGEPAPEPPHRRRPRSRGRDTTTPPDLVLLSLCPVKHHNGATKSYAEIVQGAHRDPPPLKADIWSLLMVLVSEYDFKKVPPQRVQRQIHGAGAAAAGRGGVGAGPVARVALALDLAAGIAAAILCLNPREQDSCSPEGLPHFLKLAPGSEALSMTA
jgi:hypothetical protein